MPTVEPFCVDCGPLDYNEVSEDPDSGALFCGLCGEDLPNQEGNTDADR